MANQPDIARVSLGLLLILALAGCGKQEGEATPVTTGHSHHAPHGGQLVEIGAHAFNLEFVRDRETGMLRCFVLDAHAEAFVRIAQKTIDVQVVGGDTVALRAIADARTGEEAGNTSEFAALLTAFPPRTFDAVIPSLSIRGSEFSDIKVRVEVK